MVAENVSSIHRACQVIKLGNNNFHLKPKHRNDSLIIALLTQNVESHPQEGFWSSYYCFGNQSYLWNHKIVFIQNQTDLPKSHVIKKISIFDVLSSILIDS